MTIPGGLPPRHEGVKVQFAVWANNRFAAAHGGGTV
jgi:hypothetical protein